MNVSISKSIVYMFVVFFSAFSFAEEAESVPAPVIDPQKWERVIKMFEFRDKVFPPEEGGIVFAGSSSFWLWNSNIREDLSPLNIISRGFGGSTMPDLLHFTDHIVTNYKPRAVVLYEGDNDVGAGHSASQVLDNFKLFVAKIQNDQPGMRIYIVSIKSSILREKLWPIQKEANRLLKRLCGNNPLLTYIDAATPMFDGQGNLKKDLFIEDDLHMNANGYAVMAQQSYSPSIERNYPSNVYWSDNPNVEIVSQLTKDYVHRYQKGCLFFLCAFNV